jgi:hypothetical protein
MNLKRYEFSPVSRFFVPHQLVHNEHGKNKLKKVDTFRKAPHTLFIPRHPMNCDENFGVRNILQDDSTGAGRLASRQISATCVLDAGKWQPDAFNVAARFQNEWPQREASSRGMAYTFGYTSSKYFWLSHMQSDHQWNLKTRLHSGMYIIMRAL